MRIKWRINCAVLSCAAILFLPAMAHAQMGTQSDGEAIVEACQDEEYRQFDFWVGHWQVVNPKGDVVGSNRISRVSGGCALLERWNSARGNTGASINMYEPDRQGWTQVWVSPGLILHLHGGFGDGSMVLSGEREDAQGPVMDRITWTPRPDGTVRQHWEISRDDGVSWQTVFDGRYERMRSDGG